MNHRRLRWVLVSLAIAIAGLTVAIRVAPAGGLPQAVLRVDSTFRDLSQSHRSRMGDGLARLLRQWGEPAGYLSVVSGFLLLGWLRSDRRWLRRAARVAGTLALSGLICWTLKLSIGRVRPRWSTDPAVFHPFTRAESYPSGHTTVAFALSASLAEGLVSPVGTVALYVVASGTAWSRVNDNRHWASDVVAGGLVAMLATLLVRRRWPRGGVPPVRTEAEARPSDSSPSD